jgi:hypothetical protein
MTTPGTAVRRPSAPPRLLTEAAVLVGTACLLLHLVAAVSGHGHTAVLTAVLLGMAAVCAKCLRALWVEPRRRDWQVTGAMYAAMLTAHLWWLGAGPVHVGHAHPAGGPTWGELGMWGGLGLTGVQLCLTAVGLTLSRERNRT